jgi:hypothetical protein
MYWMELRPRKIEGIGVVRHHVLDEGLELHRGG